MIDKYAALKARDAQTKTKTKTRTLPWNGNDISTCLNVLVYSCDALRDGLHDHF